MQNLDVLRNSCVPRGSASRYLVFAAAAALLTAGCGSSDGGTAINGGGGGASQDGGATDTGSGGNQVFDAGAGNNGGGGGAGGSAGADAGQTDGAVDASQTDAHVGCPSEGDTQCSSGGAVQTCTADGVGGRDWKTTKFCSVDSSECKIVNGVASCVAAPTCFDGVKNQDETGKDCGGTHCDPCPAGEGCVSAADCESDACSNSVCAVCKANTTQCECGAVKRCNAQQTAWSTVAKCSTSTVCSASQGKCVSAHIIGSAAATGDYYMFALFKGGGVQEWLRRGQLCRSGDGD